MGLTLKLGEVAKIHVDSESKTFFKLFLFIIVSGSGLLISFIILYFGVYFFDLSPFVSNLIGDVAAVSFVFITASRKVFFHHNTHMLVRFVVWLIYNVLMILSISYGVEKGKDLSFFKFLPLLPPPMYVKMFIAPFSLCLNFIFARLLIEKIRN